MNIKTTIIILTLLLSGCSGYKKMLYQGEKGLKYARLNAIIDFAYTYKTPRRYIKRYNRAFNAFMVFVRKPPDTNLSAITIIPLLPEYDKWPLLIKDTLGKVPGYFPNNYYIVNEKLFLWNDSITPLSREILQVMDKYQVLDSTDIKRELGLLPEDFVDNRVDIIDHGLKTVKYFICKNDIRKYKKKCHCKAFKHYNPPKLKCKSSP
jgi:hypothetical protein